LDDLVVKSNTKLVLAAPPTASGDIGDELNLPDDEGDREREQTNMKKERAQEQLIQELKEYVTLLRPSKPEADIKKGCQKLMEKLGNNEAMPNSETKRTIKEFLIANHGLLPLISLLNMEPAAIITMVLKLISMIIDSREILVSLCVLGVIPAMMECGDNTHSHMTRMYVAYFVQRVISMPETLQMFVACRGLSLLVEFLEPNYQTSRELVNIAVDCIFDIFRTQFQATTPKNEYFHLFMGVGFIERLSVTLVNLIKSGPQKSTDLGFDADEEYTLVEKSAKLLQVFSAGDSDVKARICSKDVLNSNIST